MSPSPNDFPFYLEPASLAELPLHPILNPVRVPPLDRVDHPPSHQHREVQVVAAGEPRGVAPADLLSAHDAIADLDVERHQVPVQGLHAQAVIDDHAVAVDAKPARVDDRAGVGREHGDVFGDGKVEPEVDLLVDVLAFVDVGAVIREAGLDLRVAELHERTVPEALCGRLLGKRRDFVRVDATQFAIHLEEAGQHVAGGHLHLQLGRVLNDLGHDTVDVLVVDLNPASPRRLLEHVVDECRLGLVAGFVAGEGGDWRRELLLRQQRKERDSRVRARASDARAGRWIARILDVAHADARPHVGRRCPIHDHLGAAVIDVVMRRDDGDARRLESHLEILGCRARERAEAEERRAGGRDDNTCGSLLELGHALLAERSRNAHAVAINLRERGTLRPDQGEQRHRAAVLLERDGQGGKASAGRRHGDVHRSGLADEAVRLADCDCRRRTAASRVVRCACRRQRENDEAK